MSAPAEAFARGQFGPVAVGGRIRVPGRLDWRRIGTYLTSFVLIVALSAASTAGALVYLGYVQVDRIDVPGLQDSTSTTNGVAVVDPGADDVAFDEARGVTNILVVGNDSREGLTDEQLLQLGTEDDGTNLTDTILLLQLNADSGKAAMLSFPRDLLVQRCDGQTRRINSAYAAGEERGAGRGPDCVVRTVDRLVGVGIDHYVEVNMLGFIEAVDAVGGVTFHVDEPLRDTAAGLDIDSGCVTFDGAKALGFVRARKALDSDFGRIARQQRFLRELIAEATAVQTLSNPAKVVGLVRSVGGAVTTDNRLSPTSMAQLAYTFRGLGDDDLATYTVPATPDRLGDADIVRLQEEPAQVLFDAFRRGELADGPPRELVEAQALAEAEADSGTFDDPLAAAGDAASEEATSSVDQDLPEPADVSPVRVLNGAGVSGLATQAAAALAERGIAVADSANADAFDYATTQLLAPPELLDEARVVAGAMGVEDLVADAPEGSALTLVLGADFDADTLPDPGDGDPLPAPEDADGEVVDGEVEESTEEASEAATEDAGEEASEEASEGADAGQFAAGTFRGGEPSDVVCP